MSEALPPDIYEPPVSPYDEIRRFMEQEGQFTTPADFIHAQSLVTRLEARHGTHDLPTDALAALRALVPVSNGRGKRQIAGKTIPPAMEAKIASRLDSPEVDITAPDGSWGKLPLPVKMHAATPGSSVSIELTSNCTVGCSFCTLANVGPIATKVSMDSAMNVVRRVAQWQLPHMTPDICMSDCFYWGTDPFDAKWRSAIDGTTWDYRDMAGLHRNFGRTMLRGLGTSTAVPLGEEFQIMRFAHEFVRNGGEHSGTWLRISKTQANAERVGHMLTVLGALHADTRHIRINNVADHIAKRGNKLQDNPELTLWDIIGPNCKDHVLIGAKSVDVIVMQGASIERPDGETRTPIVPLPETGAYRLPHFQEAPQFNPYNHPSAIYPFVTYRTVTPRPDGSYGFDTVTDTADPHRALLQLAGSIVHYDLAKAAGVTTAQDVKKEYATWFGPALAVVRDYLSAGNHNPSMAHVLTKLREYGYIDT